MLGGEQAPQDTPEPAYPPETAQGCSLRCSALPTPQYLALNTLGTAFALYFPALGIIAAPHSQTSMDYGNLEVKGFWMLASILLCVRREQAPPFKHGARETSMAARARAAGKQSLVGAVLESNPLNWILLLSAFSSMG